MQGWPLGQEVSWYDAGADEGTPTRTGRARTTVEGFWCRPSVSTGSGGMWGCFGGLQAGSGPQVNLGQGKWC